MKRLAFYLILLVAIAAGLVWALMRSPGYVLLTYDHFRYESTLWIFVGLLFALWLIMVLVRRSLGLMLFSSSFFNPWSRRFRERRLVKASLHGQRELAEGRWDRALGHLRVAADYDQRPLVHYLGAARAANEMRQYEQCDELLVKALKREPAATLAVGLSKAQLLMERGDHSEARKTLDDLHLQFPRQSQVMLLLQQLHVQLKEWGPLCHLLPDLRKQRILPSARQDELERLAWTAELERTAHEPADREEVLRKLQQRWQDMPSSLRGETLLIASYANGLYVLGAEEKARELLYESIRRHYEPVLVDLFGRVKGIDPAQQQAQAEGWLKTHADDPVLLLALGRLSLRNGQLDKARDYFEQSLRITHRPETCIELACLFARQGDIERSNKLFQESLEPADRSLPAPVR
ncbi:heme biosynthesis HemY N-terminal domain-containing protein [Azomonas macrocytogenes]|uniref:HemY protein n=1 Tax=Azomonas macrocytogenes TaxID=69962 RepID=A0A839T4I4_AZOMA|nr:heme biosynthesis HemY N-terminal domain-containing protein [Azomonas macrocytogenes]MBB3104342.1 HemY protein [Azomonas macrocytogenes]